MSAVSVKRGSATITETRSRIGELPLPDALPDDRVAVRGVGPDQKKAVGRLEVRVRSRRPVGAERPRVAKSRRGHAEARVRVEVVRADESLRELARHVVLLGEELAGAVERHGIRSVGSDDLANARGGELDRRRPCHTLERQLSVAAQHRIQQPRVGAERGREMHRLGADIAEVRRMLGITLHAVHKAAVHAHEQAAADTAVGTERAMPVIAVGLRQDGRYSADRQLHDAPVRALSCAGSPPAASSRKFRIESRSQK